MDEYFKIKTFFEFTLPLIIVGILIGIFIISLIRAMIIDYLFNKKAKILIDAGYERYLFDVASVGDGATWGYILKDGDRWKDQLKDRKIYEMSIGEIKARIKSLNN